MVPGICSAWSISATNEVTSTALNNLGFALRRQQKLDAAEVVLRKLVETATRVRGESHPETLAYATNLVSALTGAAKLAEAEPLARRVFEEKTRVLGPAHAETVISQSSLGMLQCRQRREEGERLLRELLQVVEAPDFQGRYPPALYRGRLGACLTHLGRYTEAEPLLKAAHGDLAAALGAEDSRARDAAGDLAALYQSWGQPAEADRWRARAQPARTP